MRLIGTLAAGAALALMACTGCDRSSDSAGDAGGRNAAAEVVVYTSVDEPYARPIIEEFQRRTGIKVSLVTDTEAQKSAGLAARLEAERDEPRADVWWGNEIFHTINLAEAGTLAPYESPSAADVPALFKDAEHRWAGCGLRARVLAVNTKPPRRAWDPRSAKGLDALTDPALKGKIALARPTAGTTGGHVAALYVLWGPEKFGQYFRALRANDVKLLGGNSVVAEQVARGTLWAGLTDNDDVASAAKLPGASVDMVLPDQDTVGTLTIPTTVALVAGAPQPESAKKLIDYLLSAEVEKKLIDTHFARYSVRGGEAADGIKPMEIDYRAAAQAMSKAVELAMTILEDRK
jgi:iron(III) transport system substrate-binding protein